MMEKRWVVKAEPKEEAIENLSQFLKLSKPLLTILCQRGINSFEEAKAYFRPSLDDLHDPFLMKDMDKAVNRLNDALHYGEKILVYGDYDVDGTTSVALAYLFLKKYFPNIAYYIPDRYTEGYGVSLQGIDYAKANGFTLIVSLDCGIKSADKIAYAKEQGVDFIVCDHHLPDDNIPDAAAVLDPKRPDCLYPYKELSGCGVGFKLMQAFCIQNCLDTEDLYSLLDLLVVSIAADIVPITGENRILAYYGLQVLNNENIRPGFAALKALAGFNGPLNITNIVFGFAPRINAAGRISDAKNSVAMLISETLDEAFAKADIVNEYNKQRKTFDSSITQEAISMIDGDDFLRNARTTVLYKDTWHKGVVGIVASRCIERYYRPTIILTEANGKAAGSARSVIGFDVHSAISECSDLLEQYGGHMYAAGLTLKIENVEPFKKKFEEVVSSRITDELLIPLVDIDTKIKLSQITPNFFKILNEMAPFGPGNMSPVFLSECVYVQGDVRVLKENGLKMKVTQDGFCFYEAIGFNISQFEPQISKGIPFDICYSIEENHFRGVVTLQLRIKDIKFRY